MKQRHENLGYGMTLGDEIDGYMGVVDVAKEGNMKH